MRRTIRFRLFVIITGLIAFFVFVSWVLNGQLLERFYLLNKKNSLLQTYQAINNLFRDNNDNNTEIELELEKLENIKGVRIIVADRNYRIKYSSFLREVNPRLLPQDQPSNRRMDPLFLLKTSSKQQIRAGQIKVIKDPRLNIEIICLATRLDNGDYLLLSTPKAAIKESAMIANRFSLFTGFFTIMAGGILAGILAGRFIKPILELKEIAEKMAQLDFNRKYCGKTGDELDELGESINSLSVQLESSIANLRKANEKLQQEVERERRIDEMRKEFISNVSHELKTPIALIQGYAEGLKLNVIEDDESKNFYCDVIRDEAAKMNRMVKQLLELARIESGSIPLARVNFNLSHFLTKVLEKKALLFQEKAIRLETEIEEGLFVNADPDLTEQVINNYLSNALNHVNDFRIIRVRARRWPGKTRVSVYNTGEHLPENELDKIWISFYKIDKARTREDGGTGLGLSIVRAIQEAHGNAYGVNNIAGGVEFWFELDNTDHLETD
ncbi:MAG: HAMP domain-containing protein [Firmicutes bacterium]|nr:HAMP domain-containing protein [Bacillota bacterium]